MKLVGLIVLSSAVSFSVAWIVAAHHGLPCTNRSSVDCTRAVEQLETRLATVECLTAVPQRGAEPLSQDSLRDDHLPESEDDLTLFRSRLRRALALEAEDQQLARIQRGLDVLHQEQPLVSLTEQLRSTIAATVLRFMQRIPMIWDEQQRSAHDLSWADKREAVDRAYEALRAEATEALRDFLSPTDAARIARAFVGWGGFARRDERT